MLDNSKQNLIYKSAEKLFWIHWPKKVSIDMIVKEAGVGKGTFYTYYKNKEELYESIVNDIIKMWEHFMTYLHESIPDIKERFLKHMIASVWFFENNKIIRNLIDCNCDFFYWEITHEKLYEQHIMFMKMLIWNNEKVDFDFINTVANVKWFYTEVLNKSDSFKTREDYEDFIVKLAWILVNWIFSDYERLINWRKYSDFITDCPKCSNI